MNWMEIAIVAGLGVGFGMVGLAVFAALVAVFDDRRQR